VVFTKVPVIEKRLKLIEERLGDKPSATPDRSRVRGLRARVREGRRQEARAPSQCHGERVHPELYEE